MNQTKFTPGPWKSGKNPCMTTVLDGYEGKAIYSKNGSYHIAWANAENEDGEIDIQTALANANLIAAAPEMYAELDHLKNYFIQPYYRIIFDRIEELLRKARGEREVSE